MTKSMTVSQSFSLVNAKYKLTPLELKFILNAISLLDSKGSSELIDYEIRISELEMKMQIGERQHTRLKQFAKSLMSKPLTLESENGDFEVYNWFSRIKYISGEGKFLVRFEESLKPYLLELKERFVSYNLKYILPLKSSYSVRIYQLLKEYEKLKKRTISLQVLQELLVIPASYKRYSQFKDKVLTIALREINEYTDINIDLEEIKEGKKVSKLVFRIHSKNKKNNSISLENFDFTNLYGKNCTVNNKKCSHIVSISKLENDFLLVSFKSGETFKFENLKVLLDKID